MRDRSMVCRAKKNITRADRRRAVPGAVLGAEDTAAIRKARNRKLSKQHFACPLTAGGTRPPLARRQSGALNDTETTRSSACRRSPALQASQAGHRKIDQDHCSIIVNNDGYYAK